MFRPLLVILFLVIATSLPGKEQDTSGIDLQVRKFFEMADRYMDIEYYDSAQTWLNKISAIYVVNSPTVFNYYLYSRGAEVDYYNGLNQLGITNANRGLEIALKLKDKVLLQDAYNMLGLLYLGMDRLQQGRENFYAAIRHLVAPPYPKTYLYQSMPHHIYGNLAEAYEKLKVFDSASYYSKKSLEEAESAHNQRGIAIAYNSIARICAYRRQYDSALHYYELSVKVAEQANEYDVQLLDQAGIAHVYADIGQAGKADLSLEEGISLLGRYPKMNTYFKREFLKEARLVYLMLHNPAKLQEITNAMLELEETTNKRHFSQVQFILNTSIANESRYIRASLEQDKQSKQIRINQLYIVILALCLLGIIMAFYQYSVREKLKLSNLKNKISQDLHDDVGASLSSINMSAALAEKLMDVNPEKARTVIKGISSNAEDGISTLSDIVWAMKPQTNSGTTFESKVKNYGYDLLSVNDISCSYEISPGAEAKLSNIELRKNLLLLIKEAFNNIARHSKARNVSLTLETEGKDRLRLKIKDDGTGYDPTSARHGNGIQNMEKRASDAGGSLSVLSKPGQGTLITAVFRA